MKSDEFNKVQNTKVWDEFCKYIANILIIHKVPLENVYFVNTPAFLTFFSETDKSIVQRPAADYSEFFTRRVLIEKCKNKKSGCFFHRKSTELDKISSKSLSVASFRLNWNESMYGKEFDLMQSLKNFIKSKSHLNIFLYIHSDFFESIEKTKIIRVATLDMDAI
jgi:hypothetical protein